MTTPCRYTRWIETYLDGELSPEHTVDIEDHWSNCDACQSKVKFEQALRLSMRRNIRAASQPSTNFEERLRAVMAAERNAQSPQFLSAPQAQAPQAQAPIQFSGKLAQRRHSMQAPQPSRPLTWRSIAPLSAAAAAALVFAAMRNESSSMTGGYVAADATGGMVSSKKDTMQTVREFLDQLATDTEHNDDSEGDLVEDSAPQFPLPQPPPFIVVNRGWHWPLPKFESLGGILEGLRYRTVARENRVPSVHYQIGGHRVLLWAYDSERVPLRVMLEPHVARNRPVFVGMHHGLAVAAVERQGRGYVATTDLSPSEAAELVVTAAPH